MQGTVLSINCHLLTSKRLNIPYKQTQYNSNDEKLPLKKPHADPAFWWVAIWFESLYIQ